VPLLDEGLNMINEKLVPFEGILRNGSRNLKVGE
jgi:hypothetical protein